jgi:hypothetical protein
MVQLILVRYWRSINTVVEMANAHNEHRDKERTGIKLVHEAMEKVHHAII